MNASDFRPATDRDGNVRWTGFFTNSQGKSGGTTYVMVAVGARRGCLDDSQGIAEVRQNLSGGWDVVINGEVANNERYKNSAQREAESYFISK